MHPSRRSVRGRSAAADKLDDESKVEAFGDCEGGGIRLNVTHYPIGKGT